MKVTDGVITCLLMILNVSAYENVFLEQQFCVYKGPCDIKLSRVYGHFLQNEHQKVH